MANYHINQKTGNINICRAKLGNCPLKDEKGETAPHFENKADAQLFLEQDLKNQYGTTQTLEKQKVESIKLDIHQISEYIDPIYADYHYSYESNEYGGEDIDQENTYLYFVNTEQLSKSIAGENNSDWMEIQEILEKNGADDTSNYSIEVYHGFNGVTVEIEFENKYKTMEELKKYSSGDRSMLKQKPQDIKSATYTPSFSIYNDISNFVDTEYDFKDYYSNEIDEESITIVKIDEQKFAKSIIHSDRKNKPTEEEQKQNVKEVHQMLQKIGAFDLDNYRAEAEYEYYDDSRIVIYPKNQGLIDNLEQEYYKKNNAKDKDGVLEYVRSKGQETEGLSPLDAIKEQLRNENTGKTSSLVERATEVSSKNIQLSKINIPASHRYESIEALEMKSANNSAEIAGVVYYDKASETYRLIDGYHRTKGLKGNNRKTGKYIVLS